MVHRFLTRLARAKCWSFWTITSLPTVLLVTLRATEEVIHVPHDLGFRGSTSSARCKAGRGSLADTGSPLSGDTRWYGGDTGRSFTHNTSQNTLTKEIYQMLLMVYFLVKVLVTRHIPLTAQSLTFWVSVAVAKSMDVWMFNPLSPIVDEACFPGTFWFTNWAGLAWLWACTAEQGREELSREIASFDLILQPISKCCWQSLELHNKG